MKNLVKVLVVPSSQTDPEEIEELINEWLAKGWSFIQISTFANKVYVILQRQIVG